MGLWDVPEGVCLLFMFMMIDSAAAVFFPSFDSISRNKCLTFYVLFSDLLVFLLVL